MPKSKFDWNVNVKAFAAFTAKLAGTLMVSTVTAIQLKLNLAPNAANWSDSLKAFPFFACVLLLLSIPLGWFLVDFFAATYFEVRRRTLEQGTNVVATWIAKVPGAIKSILDVYWDAATSSVSRWRFDGRFKCRVAEESLRLHAQTGFLYITAPISLETAYIDIGLAAIPAREADRRLLATTSRGNQSIYPFLRLIRPGALLAVHGRPGSGKSTMVRHLALQFARNKQGSHGLRSRIPILIELRNVIALFSKNKPPTLVDVINRFLESHPSYCQLMKRAPKNWLSKRLAAGRLLLMFDGFDEVPHAVEPAQSPRHRLATWLNTQTKLDENRNCIFILTSRPGGLEEAPIGSPVHEVEVQPLTSDQSDRLIFAFSIAYHKHRSPAAGKRATNAEAKRLTTEIQAHLSLHSHINEMRSNPLLLHMLCLLYHLRGRLPSTHSELYKETCDILTRRTDRAPGFAERMRPQDKLAVLGHIAAHFMKAESREPQAQSELAPIVAAACATIAFPQASFLRFISNDTGLLQPVDHDSWDFAHKTIAEYLCAQNWKNAPPTVAQLREYTDKDWWRQTLIFYSEDSEDSPIIPLALQSDLPSAWSLAFYCVTNNHRVRADVRELANQALLRSLNEPIESARFTRAAIAFLDYRLRDTVAIDGSNSKRRATLVTNAEFALFLRERFELYDIIPGFHERFTGAEWIHLNPSDIVSVPYRIATEFASWVSRQRGDHWRLPVSRAEGGMVPAGWSFWIDDEKPDESRDRIVSMFRRPAPPAIRSVLFGNLRKTRRFGREQLGECGYVMMTDIIVCMSVLMIVFKDMHSFNLHGTIRTPHFSKWFANACEEKIEQDIYDVGGKVDVDDFGGVVCGELRISPPKWIPLYELLSYAGECESEANTSLKNVLVWPRESDIDHAFFRILQEGEIACFLDYMECLLQAGMKSESFSALGRNFLKDVGTLKGQISGDISLRNGIVLVRDGEYAFRSGR